MDEFIPKSLDDLDKIFLENLHSFENSVNSADLKPKAEANQVSKAEQKKPETVRVQPEAPAKKSADPIAFTAINHVSKSGSAEKPLKSAATPKQENAATSFPESFASEISEEAFAKKDKPKAENAGTEKKPVTNPAVNSYTQKMLYKAAPMQSPAPDSTGSLVMPKDYGLYGKDAMQINVAAPSKTEVNHKAAAVKKERSFLSPLLAILLAVCVLVTAVTAVFSVLAIHRIPVAGRYICKVTDETKSPALKKSYLVFVKTAESGEIGKDEIVAYIDSDTKEFAYGITDKFFVNYAGKELAAVKAVNANSEITSKSIPASKLIGTAESYLPVIGAAVHAAEDHTVLSIIPAAVIIAALIIALIKINLPAKKEPSDD